MGLRGTLLWPLYRIAGWADDNPLSAAGVIVALGALAVFLASVGVVAETSGGLTFDGATATAISETALAQPAYVVAAVVGLAVFLFYDG
ncbi:MAG: hypothetical protein ACI8UR_000584 [Natronomonas sp.]|jgi:hypothetical protein|uniref:hypothetical protein n=1 Tax=Natronomonas sp. TaxID=2184060 RepID=UPI00398A3A72